MSCPVFSTMQELRVLVHTTRVYHPRPSPGARADVDTRAKSGPALSWLMPAQLPHPLSKTTATPAVCFPQLDNVTLRHLDARAISRSWWKGEDGLHGHEKASKRLASLQAMRPAPARRYAAPPPDVTGYNM